MTLVQFTYGVAYIVLFRRKGEEALNSIQVAASSKTHDNSAYTYVSVVSPQKYTFATCLQGHHETDLQLGYLGLSLGFGSYPRDGDASADPNSARHYRYSRVPHDRSVFIQILTDIRRFRTIREARTGCHRLLFGDRLGAFDGDDIHINDGRRESNLPSSSIDF